MNILIGFQYQRPLCSANMECTLTVGRAPLVGSVRTGLAMTDQGGIPVSLRTQCAHWVWQSRAGTTDCVQTRLCLPSAAYADDPGAPVQEPSTAYTPHPSAKSARFQSSPSAIPRRALLHFSRFCAMLKEIRQKGGSLCVVYFYFYSACCF